MKLKNRMAVAPGFKNASRRVKASAEPNVAPGAVSRSQTDRAALADHVYTRWAEDHPGAAISASFGHHSISMLHHYLPASLGCSAWLRAFPDAFAAELVKDSPEASMAFPATQSVIPPASTSE